MRTDSTYLKQLETAKDLSGIFYRWLNYLSRFEIMVEHTKGVNNPADGLSRVRWPMGLGDDRESLGGDGLEQTVNQLGSGSYLKPRKDLVLGQLLDTNIQRIKSILNKQSSIKSVREQEVNDTLNQYLHVLNQLTIDNGLLCKVAEGTDEGSSNLCTQQINR